MELTQGQISEIISNYTSSSEGFVTLQSLIINSLMAREANYSSKRIRMSNAMAFVLVVGIVRTIRSSCAFRVAVAAISIPYF